MGTISAEIVTRTWQAMSQFNVDNAVDFTNEMAEEQPVILAYLVALDDMPFNQPEKELIHYLGIVVWQIMKQSPKRLLKVTRKKLNRAERANLESLDFLASDTEADFNGHKMARRLDIIAGPNRGRTTAATAVQVDDTTSTLTSLSIYMRNNFSCQPKACLF